MKFMDLILRNTTLEHVFISKETYFSDYSNAENISNYSNIIWCYFLDPLHTEREKLEEIDRYYSILENTVNQITENQSLYLISIFDILPIKIHITNNDLKYKIYKFNIWLLELSIKNKNVYFIDSSNFECNELISLKYYLTSNIIISPKESKKYYNWIKHEIKKTKLNNRKKCLIVDLDNTLWCGVLGEDGIFGLSMSGDYPGNIYKWIQKTIIELKNSGIIIAIISKNNEDDVKKLWETNTNFLLKENMISAYRINWEDKAKNLIEIANELNIGTDSIVFLDDSPTERSMMKSLLPEVCVPEFPTKEYEIFPFILRVIEENFQISNLTNEDLNKTKQYIDNRLRNQFEKKYKNKNKFIKELDITIDIKPINDSSLARVTQLTNKTNQFNLTTIRYTEKQLTDIISNNGMIFSLEVKDKFGDNGLTGVCIITKDETLLNIENFLLSCRILGKKIEVYFLNSILNFIKKNHKNVQVTSKYIKSSKNLQVENFYESLGFELTESNNEIKKYLLNLYDWNFENDNLIKINI